MDEKHFTTQCVRTESDVVQFYEDYADTWDDRFGESFTTRHFIRRRWNSFLEILEASEVKRGHVVELGVGTGVYIRELSRLFIRVTAVDGSSKMLAQLAKRVEANAIQNVTIHRANVNNIEALEDGAADCVCFFGLLEHIVDRPAFFEELKRITKRGGVVIGVTPNGRSPWYSMRRLVRGTDRHCSSDRYYSLAEIRSMFEAEGFEHVTHSLWGLIPAGIGSGLGRVLAPLERVVEATGLRGFLGGLTFSFRRS